MEARLSSRTFGAMGNGFGLRARSSLRGAALCVVVFVVGGSLDIGVIAGLEPLIACVLATVTGAVAPGIALE